MAFSRTVYEVEERVTIEVTIPGSLIGPLLGQAVAAAVQGLMTTTEGQQLVAQALSQVARLTQKEVVDGR